MSLSRRSAGVLANERGLIVGWIGKIAIAFIIAGVVIFDAGSILVNLFTLDSTADEIAIELSIRVGTGTPNQQELEQSAKELATAADARLLGVEVDAEKVVRIRLRRRADTLVVERIGFIRNWALATADGQAGST
jgi:hypothetical protein